MSVRVVRPPLSQRQRHEKPSVHLDRQFADCGAESVSTADHEFTAVGSKSRCYKI